MFRMFILLGFTLFALSCNTDQQAPDSSGEKQVQGVQVDGGSISEIIRNPQTANEPLDTTNVAKMVFEHKRHDFGTVNEGDIVRHEYKFTNTGTVPLIINDAKSTCGCTVPEWPKEPIAPGKSGVISVRFDTKNKTNQQGKPITIFANTYPNKTVLQLKGMVIPAKQ